MAKKFDLSTDKGVSSLNEHLQNRSYVDGNGYRPTQLDAQLFASLTVELKECAKQVNFYRWYNHIASFSDAERKQWPPASPEGTVDTQEAPNVELVNREGAVSKDNGGADSNADNENSEERTILVYLTDTYMFVSSGTIVSVGSDQRGPYCCLDRTIFYPQGGGQPSDVGTIAFEDNETYKVTFVGMQPNGKVQHFLDRPLSNRVGQRVTQQVDQNLRLENAKQHTGGHLLSNVVESLAPELLGCKGYHFKQGPYVEFEGKLTSLSLDQLRLRAEEALRNALSRGGSVTAKEVSPQELADHRLASRYHLPAGKSARLVQIEGFEPVPCGGTHLRNISELKEVSIRKIQQPKGNVKISYVAA